MAYGTAVLPGQPSGNNRAGEVSVYAVLGVSREVPSVPSPLKLGGYGNEYDPELLALPDPPRAARACTVAMLAIAGAVAMTMAFALRGDVVYAVQSGSALGVGDLRTVAPAVLASAENRLVSAEAMLGSAGAISYERPFAGDSFRTMPVAGRTNVWVELQVPSEPENGRWEPPRSFVGRLVRFESAGLRHRGIAAAIERTTDEQLPHSAWLLVDGEVPAHARRAVVLFAVLMAFVLWNGLSIARLVRRIR